MHRDIQTISNHGAIPLAVWLEPWVEEIQIAPGSSAVFISESEHEGALEMLDGTPITVFGWPGANLRVEVNGQLVWESYGVVPDLPAGMTVRNFLVVLGLGNDCE